ncbi:MAG: hypothetical protein ACSNEK_10295 [Parachlamydiaceae bacterium]
MHRLVQVLLCFSLLCSCCLTRSAFFLPKNEDQELINQAINNYLLQANIGDEARIVIQQIDLGYVPGFHASSPNTLTALGLEAHGLEPGQEFSFYISNLEHPGMWMGNFIVNDEGRLASPRYQQNSQYFFYYILYNSHPGEEIFFVLISKDKTQTITASCIPSPIKAEWKDGAILTLYPVDRQYKTFQLKGTAFKPFEQVQLVHFAYDTFTEESVEAEEDGSLSFLLQPFIRTQDTGGEATLMVKRKKMPKKTFSYSYGQAAKSNPPQFL